MNVFLTELAKKAAERWLTLLVLPGVGWISMLIVARLLRPWPPFDLRPLRSWLDAQAAQPGNHALAMVLPASVGLLAAAAGISLAASALGAALQWLWALDGRRPPFSWLLGFRQRRWDRATEELRTAIAVAANPDAHGVAPDRAAAEHRAAEVRRAGLGTSRPERPTWIGERLRTVTRRALDGYGLNLELAWPRLWAVLPDPMRDDLALSADAYAVAARLTAWGLLYATLALAWWPAIVLGVVIVLCGWVRARAAARVLAELIETAVDLYLGELAKQLGITPTTPLGPHTGEDIDRVLRKK